MSKKINSELFAECERQRKLLNALAPLAFHAEASRYLPGNVGDELKAWLKETRPSDKLRMELAAKGEPLMTDILCPKCELELIDISGDHPTGVEDEVRYETGYGCDGCGSVFSPEDVEPVEPKMCEVYECEDQAAPGDYYCRYHRAEATDNERIFRGGIVAGMGAGR